MTTPNDQWHQRKYTVCVGMPVTGEFAKLPNAVAVKTIDGEEMIVLPLPSGPITLSYPPDKAKRVTPRCEYAEFEACERAIKVWKRDHPEDSDLELVAWSPVLVRESMIVNTLVK